MAQSAENRLDVYTDTNMCKLLGAWVTVTSGS
jgi:hypothetical protein